LPSQIPLHLETAPSLTRADFIVAEGNRDALAFVESWPGWAVPRAAIYGPAASGKSHIAEIWSARSGAQRVSAAALSGSAFVLLDRSYPIIVEDVDSSLPNPARDTAIFELLESASLGAPVLVTGRTEPPSWPVILPDLGSRFSALVSFSVWAPDAELLRKLAQKLFRDRQLAVPVPVIDRMLAALERSPQAVRDFVAKADSRALAEHRAVNSALIRELLAEIGCDMTDSGDLFNFGHEVGPNSPHGKGKG
jgi:chromosomal replication initiation ATPase DnaA